MAMFKKTAQYLKRSFAVLALIAIVPSLIISFFVRPFANITVLPTLFVGQTDYNFTDIFMNMFSSLNSNGFWVGFVGYILFFAFLWLAGVSGICIVEKHLRTGELSPVPSKNQFFSYFMPMFYTLLIWAFMYLLSTVIQSGLISLIHYVCGETPPSVLDCILSTLIALAILALNIFLVIHFMFLPPIMVNYGYGLRESFVQSQRLTYKNLRSLFFGLIVPILTLVLIEYLLSLLTALVNIDQTARYWIDYAITALFHMLVIVYIISYDTITFFELNGLERRDLKQYRG